MRNISLLCFMHSSSKQPFVGEEHCVTSLITAAKETIHSRAFREMKYTWRLNVVAFVVFSSTFILFRLLRILRYSRLVLRHRIY